MHVFFLFLAYIYIRGEFYNEASNVQISIKEVSTQSIIKRPTRDACLCMGDLQAPPAPHFVFLITL